MKAWSVAGLRGLLKAAALAEAGGLPVAPHTHLVVSLPVAAAIPNALAVEHMPLRDGLFMELPARRGGSFIASEEPGLGICWKPDALARYRVA